MTVADFVRARGLVTAIFADKSGYLMDKDNIIYFYSAELQAAVESLNSYACDSSGKEIRFSFMYAKRTMILSCEDALKQLTA